MKNIDIVKAWKDETYRNSLTAEQLATLPANPAGDLSVEEQSMVTGGGGLGGGLRTQSGHSCMPMSACDRN